MDKDAQIQNLKDIIRDKDTERRLLTTEVQNLKTQNTALNSYISDLESKNVVLNEGNLNMAIEINHLRETLEELRPTHGVGGMDLDNTIPLSAEKQLNLKQEPTYTSYICSENELGNSRCASQCEICRSMYKPQ